MLPESYTHVLCLKVLEIIGAEVARIEPANMTANTPEDISKRDVSHGRSIPAETDTK